MRIIAHRGAMNVTPENTMSAFRAAAELGADGIELDVQEAADGALVVIHDQDVARTSDGRGRVREMTLPELRALDAGSWFGASFRGEQVPTLEEVLRLDGVTFEIELMGLGPGFVERVVAAVDAHRSWASVEVTSAHIPLLMALKRIRPRVRTGLFAPRRPPWASTRWLREAVIRYADILDAAVIHVPIPDLDGDLVTAIRMSGRLLHGADADTEEGLTRAANAGVDQVSTADVEAAIRVRSEMRSDRDRPA